VFAKVILIITGAAAILLSQDSSSSGYKCFTDSCVIYDSVEVREIGIDAALGEFMKYQVRKYEKLLLKKHQAEELAEINLTLDSVRSGKIAMPKKAGWYVRTEGVAEGRFRYRR